jgi:hypothetical protein
MEELREMLRTIIREELGKPKKAKAEFLELGRFNTGPNTQIRVSVAENENGVSVGLAKVHGDFVEKTFGFKLTPEAAAVFRGLLDKYYPDTARKRGRGA